MPKHAPLVALLSLCAFSLQAAPPAVGDVTAVDSKLGAITVSVGGKPHAWRVRPDTVVTVNGKKASLTDLTPKMVVKVTANDPSIALKVEATSMSDSPAPSAANTPLGPDGKPLTGPELRAKIYGVKIVPNGLTNADGTANESPLAALIAESKWRTADGKILTLHANGTTEGSWPGSQGTWKVLDDRTVEWTFEPKAKAPSRVTIDSSGNNASWKDDFGAVKTARRVGK